MVRRLFATLCLPAILAAAVCAQTTIKAWTTYEDYCRDNPHAPTCQNGHPIKMDATTLTDPMAGYCKKEPHSPGCEGYCQRNPKALNCIDTKPLKTTTQPASTGTAFSNTAPERRGNGPSIIEIPTSPAHGARSTAKLLNLPAGWQFANPHADALLGINVASLRSSDTLRSIMAKLAEHMGVTPTQLDNALAETGEVDQYWISLHAKESLILLQGRIDAPPDLTNLSNGMAVFRISQTAMVVGPSASVGPAVQRLRQPASMPSASARQMKELGADSDVWITGTKDMLAQAKSSPLANDLSSYLLGFSFRNGFQADLKLNYATVAAARRVFSELLKSPPPPGFPVHVTFGISGTAIRMQFAVEQAKLLEAVDRVLDAPAAKPWLAMAGKSLQASNEMVIEGLPGGKKTIQAVPNAPPPPDKFVIYGLPGGPKVL